jgi:intracellular sulfur oxidation DsrE/DsrF family protein
VTLPSTTRAAFLGAGAIGVAIAAAGCNAAAEGVADQSSIEAILRRPARHKQVSGAPRIDGGAALRYAQNGLNAFQTAFHEGPSTFHIACVMYGTSLLFVANDSLWSRYRAFDVLDGAGDPLPLMIHTPQNPFYHSVEALSERGVSWFVCNNALTELTGHIASARALAQSTVYDDFRANFAPGTTVVPSGVATVVLAQEAGFTFLPG